MFYIRIMEELIERLFEVVAFDLKHAHYKHTVKKSKLYRQLIAGENLDDLLRQFVRRENKALFKQRVNLTQHIVTAVSNNLLDIKYKVPRSNSARRILTYKGDTPMERVRVLEGVINKFWGNESWDDYMSTRFIQLGDLDPNCFVVLEWDDFDANHERLAPRPFEVYSHMAVDYKKDNNVLKYLIVKEDYTYKVIQEGNKQPISNLFQKPDDKTKKGIKYTLYGPSQVVKLIQVDEKIVMDTQGPATDGELFEKDGLQYIKLGEKYYQYIEATPHNLGYVNALQPGYLRDPLTNGDTFVNLLHRVEPYLLKTIKVNSEFDLVATLIAMPQLIKYGIPCDADDCYKGYTSDNVECTSCSGTGIKKTAHSAQDAIVIRMPSSKEEMIPLADLMTYVRPPVDVIKWQEEYIDKLTMKCKELLHNTDTFTQKQVAETATGKQLDMQNIYDTLYPFAVAYGKMWTFGVKTMAELTDLGKDLIVKLTFGKDFKMKSLDTLVFDLKEANQINNSALVQHINMDIAQIIFAEKPLELQKYETKQLFNPFIGKSEREIILLMNSPFIREEDKVLHANMSRIFDELELELALNAETPGVNFYELTREKQHEAIYKKVEEIRAQLKAEQPEPEIDLT